MKLKNINSNRLNTKDYIKILDDIDLQRYNISFTNYFEIYSSNPLQNWNINNPTKSLNWYDAYNKVKHDLENNFNYATLENCINSISAVVILFCIRYSPYSLFSPDENDKCSSIAKNLIQIKLNNLTIDDFFIPCFHQ